MSNSVTVERGFRGTVTGITRAERYQRASLELKNASGRLLGFSTLTGFGENAPMTQEINKQPAWSFGPFGETMTITVTIESAPTATGSFVASKSVAPVTIKKLPDTENLDTFVVSTVSQTIIIRRNNFELG
ncbi:hypothetical protein BDQ12DRAFT_66321 [Crucibulum laeve]|uniref:Uncharacterized protein n=1 Tax=Crucibulum laeve TaxID=68775 RepID=A0A5C3LIC1_9AGAR|nr:hypothetical protein BDQ12DRAFT_66321 [Crucibulum laeve]